MSHQTTTHVLVVDDEPELRELLQDGLGAQGLRVTAAPDVRSAVESAVREHPDFLVTDLLLGEGTGLDVIDQIRLQGQEIPSVVITGYSDGPTLMEASRHGLVELMPKPLDIQHLADTIRGELKRRGEKHRLRERSMRLRKLARRFSDGRKAAQRKLETTCADLAGAFRSLSGQMSLQKNVIAFQNELVSARNDDDVFRSVFQLFSMHSGPLFGLAMVCDADAELRVAGRFGVPYPDSLDFCGAISKPVIDQLLANPKCLLLDAGDHAEMFPEQIRRKLIGVSVLAIPLVPAQSELIGMVILYRKGEQPFIDTDVNLAEMIGYPTSLAVRRTD